MKTYEMTTSSVYIDPELYDALVEYARMSGVSVARAVQQIVEEIVEIYDKHGLKGVFQYVYEIW